MNLKKKNGDSQMFMENQKNKIMKKEIKENWEGNLKNILNSFWWEKYALKISQGQIEKAMKLRKQEIERIFKEIRQLLKSEKNQLLERIKLEYDKPTNRDTKWITKEQSNYWVDGYNKAVEDLENLRNQLKKKNENYRRRIQSNH